MSPRPSCAAPKNLGGIGEFDTAGHALMEAASKGFTSGAAGDEFDLTGQAIMELSQQKLGDPWRHPPRARAALKLLTALYVATIWSG